MLSAARRRAVITTRSSTLPGASASCRCVAHTRCGLDDERRAVARYREKDETDLVWNRIRRQITRDLDTEIQNRREEVLNTLLSSAWDDYVAAIGTGELREVEARYSKLVKAIVEENIVRPELVNGDVADS